MIDFENLKRIYKFGKSLSMKEINYFLNSAKLKVYKKKELLIDFGSSSTEVFFINKGLVRVYYINEKGTETTLALLPESNIIVNLDQILYDKKSRFYFEAFEKTQTFSLDYQFVQDIFEAHPKLEKNRKYMLHFILKQMQKRIESFVLFNSEERYEMFIKDNPGIDQRVPDKYIANVLGITPVSLSRIRSKINQKK